MPKDSANKQKTKQKKNMWSGGFCGSADHRVKMKESEKINKYAGDGDTNNCWCT